MRQTNVELGFEPVVGAIVRNSSSFVTPALDAPESLSEEYIGRWEFEGEQIEDSPYLLMDISHLLGNRQNPVMYVNM